MTVTLLILIFAALFVVGTLLNIALLRVICLVWRVPDATWWRSTRVVLTIVLVNTLGNAIVLGLYVLERKWRVLSEGMLEPAALAVFAFIGLVVPLWAFSAGLKISLAKALGVFLSLTIASTIAAYGLAFVLRATLAEAFVVPTGAMAPTVIGQHIHVRCPNCNREVDVGVTDVTLMMYGWDEINREGYTCQQCGDPRLPLEESLISGDRVLVDKTARRPQRFDIAVFHVRADQLEGFNPGLPPARDQKYIKRCVGLPGEEIAIVDGDLFVDGERLQKGPHEAEDLWLAVHDTNFRAFQPVGGGPTWRAAETYASGWKSQQREWQIRSDADLGAELEFTGVLSDRYAYEFPLDAEHHRPLVRDWRITVDLREFTGNGALGFFWRQEERTTCLAVTPQRAVQVFRDTSHFANQEDVAGDAGKINQPARQVSFAVRDGKAYLAVDGEVLATVELLPTGLVEARAEFRRVDSSSSPPLQFGIVARQCNATLRRIQLHRDIYYRDLRQLEWPRADDSAWQLDDHYFFLGDQSPQSQDCRFIGPIHEREMIGIARWCYWPPERMREFPQH